MREWLPCVINEVQPFMSSEIDAGSRWQAEIATELKSTTFGIIFVTADNQKSPWLNFEAGALAKTVSDSHVVPLAIDLDLADIQLPLGQFQAQKLNFDGISRIVYAINRTSGNPLSEELIDKLLHKWWPDLEEAVKKLDLVSTVDAAKHIRPQGEMLEEILTTLRALARQQIPSRRSNIRNYMGDQEDLDLEYIFDEFAIIMKDNGGFKEMNYSSVLRVLTIVMEPNVAISDRVVKQARRLATAFGIGLHFTNSTEGAKALQVESDS